MKEIARRIKELQAMLVAPQDDLDHVGAVRLLAALDEAERRLKRKVEEKPGLTEVNKAKGVES